MSYEGTGHTMSVGTDRRADSWITDRNLRIRNEYRVYRFIGTPDYLCNR